MKTILLIEDNDIMRENTAEILELFNYQVLMAENGTRGVELALIAAPDLIICDIAMPEMDGIEVLQKMCSKEKTKKIPFIFLTAYSEKLDVARGLDLGADEYLTKPYRGEDLINVVDRYLHV